MAHKNVLCHLILQHSDVNHFLIADFTVKSFQCYLDIIEVMAHDM